MTTERFVLGDGAELSLVRVGNTDSDVTVVLLHGFAADRRVWHKVLDLLPRARDVQVIAYDQRGHGDSSRADSRTATLERLADDLGEVIERTPGRVVLVGHGMGGLVAMDLLGRRDVDRVSGLVVLAASGGDLGVPRSMGRLVQDLHAILGPFIVGQVRRKIDKATAVGLRWLMLGDDPDADDVRLVAEMVVRHWPDVVALFQSALDRRAPPPDGIPVLALVGERDRLVPAGSAAALVRGVRLGHAVTLPGCGHMVPLEAAAQVVPRIVGLIGNVSRNG